MLRNGGFLGTFQGKAQREGAALAGAALHIDCAVMILSDLLNNSQPKAGSAPGFLGGEEWVEDVRECLRRDTDPRVLHLNDGLIILCAERQGEGPPVVSMAW